MARCLTPITIKSPGLDLSPHSCPSFYWKDTIKPYQHDSLIVPCGKCINCLKNKQSSMVVRIKREAEKRGSLSFLTLTYDDDHLPIAQSLWTVDRETGEQELCVPAEIISSARHPDPVRLNQLKEILPSSIPRYIDIPIPAFSLDGSGKDYFARLTPSICREDVRIWIKKARIQYERAFGKKLEMSYCVVSEYGPRTCRPHYHLAIMGISKDTLSWLAQRWDYGFTRVDWIPRVQSGNNDPWSGVAFYIGKYMTKGKFECESVVNGSAEKPRICQSISLGVGDIEPLRPFVCCFDMVGEYDLNTLCKKSGEKLSKRELDLLCEEVPKRLVYRLNDKIVLPLPRLIRNKIFYNTDKYEKPVKTQLWYLVTVALRNKYDSLRQQEFREFLTSDTSRTVSEMCAAFETNADFLSSIENSTGEKNLQRFYASSIF